MSRAEWLYVRSAKWKKVGREKWKYRFVKLEMSQAYSRYTLEYYKQEDAPNPRARLFLDEECRVTQVTNSKHPFVFDLWTPLTVQRFCARTFL